MSEGLEWFWNLVGELIFPHLSTEDLLRCRLVCRKFNVGFEKNFSSKHVLYAPDAVMRYEEMVLGWKGVQQAMAREERTRENVQKGVFEKIMFHDPGDKGKVIMAYEAAGSSLVVRFQEGWSIMRRMDGEGYEEVMTCESKGSCSINVTMMRRFAVIQEANIVVVDVLTMKKVLLELNGCNSRLQCRANIIMQCRANIIMGSRGYIEFWFWEIIVNKDGSEGFEVKKIGEQKGFSGGLNCLCKGGQCYVSLTGNQLKIQVKDVRTAELLTVIRLPLPRCGFQSLVNHHDFAMVGEGKKLVIVNLRSGKIEKVLTGVDIYESSLTYLKNHVIIKGKLMNFQTGKVFQENYVSVEDNSGAFICTNEKKEYDTMHEYFACLPNETKSFMVIENFKHFPNFQFGTFSCLFIANYSI